MELQRADLYVGILADAHLEAEAQGRKLEEDLRSKKDMQVSTTMLASGVADKVGEQDNRLETLAGCFAKPVGFKLLWIKVQALVTKPDWDTKRWNPWESEENKEEDVMDSETDAKPCAG